MSVRESMAHRLGTLEILVLATIALPLARIAAARIPLPRLRILLNGVFVERRTAAPMTAKHVGRCVTAIGRRMPRVGNCLTHALVTEALLHRFGLPAEFVIGVQRSSAEFRAHAWVASAGVVVVGDALDLDRFVPLVSGVGPHFHRPQPRHMTKRKEVA